MTAALLTLCFAACQGAGGGGLEDGWWHDASDTMKDAGSEDGSGQEEEPLKPSCRPWAGLKEQALREELRDYVSGHKALSYDQARRQMFSNIDNRGGWVECVYTGQRIQTSGIPDANVMNTEHTWCQSWGADTLPARSDLQHLFPVMAFANTTRSNNPFGEVVLVDWESGGSKLGLDGWGALVFEPRDTHKGDAARAIFYFSLRYSMGVDDRMEEVLRTWNKSDPPDEKEIDRADKIESIQERRNPLVDCPELVDLISNF